jgi:predicted AAA+ superfamily ATPase
MINRVIENKLLKTINNFPVTGIIGPRQVGKTTLAKHLVSKIDKETIYIDLENPRDRVRLSDPNLFFEANMDKCIILDEIQLMPELFSVLRPMVDMNREPIRYILLGSASPVLIRESSQTLAGRIAYIELSGFNLTEIQGKNQNELWLRGGFPDAYLALDNDVWMQWLDNFISTYIERDLPLLGLNVSHVILRNLWMMVAHIHGNVVNYSNISRSLELSSTTVKKYLDFLENAFLIRQLRPFYVNIKKRIVKSPKLFIRDSGILHNLLNISSGFELEGNPMKGNSFEGFAIEQILQKTDIALQAYFYRTQHGAECDLVLTKSSKPRFAIEIKYAAAPQLTKGNLISFDDIGAKYNFVITPDSEDYLISKHIRVCSLYTFLTKYINL